MAFQINQLTFDFHSGVASVSLSEPPVPPARNSKNVGVNFPLKPTPTGGTPDSTTEAEMRAEAKRILQDAANSL